MIIQLFIYESNFKYKIIRDYEGNPIYVKYTDNFGESNECTLLFDSETNNILINKTITINEQDINTNFKQLIEIICMEN